MEQGYTLYERCAAFALNAHRSPKHFDALVQSLAEFCLGKFWEFRGLSPLLRASIARGIQLVERSQDPLHASLARVSKALTMLADDDYEGFRSVWEQLSELERSYVVQVVKDSYHNDGWSLNRRHRYSGRIMGYLYTRVSDNESLFYTVLDDDDKERHNFFRELVNLLNGMDEEELLLRFAKSDLEANRHFDIIQQEEVRSLLSPVEGSPARRFLVKYLAMWQWISRMDDGFVEGFVDSTDLILERLSGAHLWMALENAGRVADEVIARHDNLLEFGIDAFAHHTNRRGFRAALAVLYVLRDTGQAVRAEVHDMYLERHGVDHREAIALGLPYAPSGEGLRAVTVAELLDLARVCDEQRPKFLYGVLAQLNLTDAYEARQLNWSNLSAIQRGVLLGALLKASALGGKERDLAPAFEGLSRPEIARMTQTLSTMLSEMARIKAGPSGQEIDQFASAYADACYARAVVPLLRVGAKRTLREVKSVLRTHAKCGFCYCHEFNFHRLQPFISEGSPLFGDLIEGFKRISDPFSAYCAQGVKPNMDWFEYMYHTDAQALLRQLSGKWALYYGITNSKKDIVLLRENFQRWMADMTEFEKNAFQRYVLSKGEGMVSAEMLYLLRDLGWALRSADEETNALLEHMDAPTRDSIEALRRGHLPIDAQIRLPAPPPALRAASVPRLVR